MPPNELLTLGFSNVLKVLALAASPISELRGAIPVAIIAFHFPWYYALLLAIIGNLVPVPFILLFLNAVSRVLSKIGVFRRMLHWLFEHARRRGKIVKRYERIGLVLFVAIPLPMTGAWTGSVAAALFGLKFKHALSSIVIGIFIAGVIVTCATLLSWTIFGLWRF